MNISSSNSLYIGSILNGNKQYTIEKVLGQGGFGITYLAKGFYMDGNIRRSAQYTIKELFMSDICNREADGRVSVRETEVEQFAESKTDFKWEATCLFNLSQKRGYSRNIVPVNEVFEENNTIYYVMDYLGDESLYKYVTRRIDQRNPMSVQEILDVMSQVAKAVSFLHENYILHLDIKPENVMMRADGETVVPVLIDFGLAKYYSKNGTLKSKNGAYGFSKGYSPVEQKNGIDTFMPSADVYALSATLLYMFTGKEPMSSEEVAPKLLYDEMPQSVPQNIQDTIVRGMAREASSRIKSVGELIEMLGIGMTVLDDEGGRTIRSGGGSNKTQRVGRGVKRQNTGSKTYIYIAVAVAAVVILIGIVFAVGGGIGLQKKAVENTKLNDEKGQYGTTGDNPPEYVTDGLQEDENAGRAKGKTDWDYATYNGYMRDGLPDGKGIMRFKKRHAIAPNLLDKMVDKGEWFSGEFNHGNIVEGTLYDASNQKKEYIDMRTPNSSAED